MSGRLLVLLGALFLSAGCDGSFGVDRDAAVTLGDAGRADAGAASDAATPDAATPDAAGQDAGPIAMDAGSDAGAPVVPPPGSIFFVGNSFTFGGPVPSLVEDLAIYAGFPPPDVDYRAVGGQTLEGHRADTDPAGAPARVREGWDALVLQENSLRPTDSYGPAAQFYEDATWFRDLAKEANPACEVVLFETWARRFDHAVYPGTFADPADMQAELRFHYFEAAERVIPADAMALSTDETVEVRVAPAGDAWERQLESGEPPRLHADDSWHAAAPGQYLNAIVIYSTIYRRRADGLVPLRGLSEGVALELQAAADATTSAMGWGVVRGTPAPVAMSDAFAFDLGPVWVDGWHALTDDRLTVAGATSESGAPSTVHATTWGFSGTQTGGVATNDVGWPDDVGSDSLWVGSFGSHAAALLLEGRLVVRGLPPGRYRVDVFASRVGDDGGRGRLTRYRIGTASADLEVADNRGALATFDDVSPDARGEVLLRVGVSPDGTARFAYLGAVRVTRTGS
jgi:hypothetical protein